MISDGIVILLIGIAIGAVATTAFVLNGSNNRWEAKAIENSCAHYDTITAEFVWNNEVKRAK